MSAFPRSRPAKDGTTLSLFDMGAIAAPVVPDLDIARNFEPYTRARTEDPDTSAIAAERIAGDEDALKERQKKVLSILREFPGGLTHEDTIRICRQRFGWKSESTARTRVAELVELGLAERATDPVTGQEKKRTLASGGPGLVWRATPATENTPEIVGEPSCSGPACPYHPVGVLCAGRVWTWTERHGARGLISRRRCEKCGEGGVS